MAAATQKHLQGHFKAANHNFAQTSNYNAAATVLNDAQLGATIGIEEITELFHIDFHH
jgi:hypothetical protein